MKRIILAAAFTLAISGFAAAQSTSTKPASQKAIVKKGPALKTSSKNTVLKQEESSSAKQDAVKLVLPMPATIADSTAMPAVKNDE